MPREDTQYIHIGVRILLKHLFWNLYTYWPPYVIIYYNPAILHVHWNFNKLKHIQGVANFSFSQYLFMNEIHMKN